MQKHNIKMPTITWIALTFALIFIVYFIITFISKKAKKSKKIGKIKLIKKKQVVFATPHRAEMILLSLYFIFFFIADLAQNKIIDLGTDYKVTIFWHTKILALDVWIIFLILFHLVLMAMFLMSLRSKATNRIYDIIAGVIGFFGVAILLAGVINMIYSPTIHFLFMDLASIDFYHVGAYTEMAVGIYWAFTR